MPKELNAEDDLGLDDSFSKFTVLRDDEDIDDDSKGGDDDDAKTDDDDATDDLTGTEDSNFEFDLSKMPEEQKKIFEPILKKMQSAYTKKTQGLADLKKKAAIADVLLSRGGKSGIGDDDRDKDADRGKELDAGSVLTELKSLKFEQNDYYAPFFKKIIDALETVATSAKKEVGNFRKEDTVSKIKSWFKVNEAALPLMAKMDEIGRENPTLYSNLDDLYILASVKAGKGIPGKKKISQNENLPKLKPKVRPTSLRNVIELSGLPEGKHAKPKINSIADAFKVAQEQLAEE